MNLKQSKYSQCPSGNNLDEEMSDIFGCEKLQAYYELNIMKYLKCYEERQGHADLMQVIAYTKKLDTLMFGKIDGSEL